MQPQEGSRATALETLVTGLNSLVTESKALRRDVELQRREQLRRGRIQIAGIVVVALFLLGSLVITVQNRGINQQNTRLSRQIADCTTDGGICHGQDRVRSNERVQELARINTAIAHCARVTDTYPALADCVRRLTGPSPAPTPGG